MSICRGCGAQIEWIKTTAGRNMPVDPEPVFVIEGEGCDCFVLDDGAVIVGRIARPEEERPELPVAFVPHITKAGPRCATVQAGVDALVKAGAINSPDYWLQNYGKLQSLDLLLCALGGAV